jgi:hypothetical protein
MAFFLIDENNKKAFINASSLKAKLVNLSFDMENGIEEIDPNLIEGVDDDLKSSLLTKVTGYTRTLTVSDIRDMIEDLIYDDEDYDTLSTLFLMERTHYIAVVYLLKQKLISLLEVKNLLRMNFYNRTEILLSYLSREMEIDGIDTFRKLILALESVSSSAKTSTYNPHIFNVKSPGTVFLPAYYYSIYKRLATESYGKNVLATLYQGLDTDSTKKLYFDTLISSPSFVEEYIDRKISTIIGYSDGSYYKDYSSVRTAIYGTLSIREKMVVEKRTPLTVDFFGELIQKTESDYPDWKTFGKKINLYNYYNFIMNKYFEKNSENMVDDSFLSSKEAKLDENDRSVFHDAFDFMIDNGETRSIFQSLFELYSGTTVVLDTGVSSLLLPLTDVTSSATPIYGGPAFHQFMFYNIVMPNESGTNDYSVVAFGIPTQALQLLNGHSLNVVFFSGNSLIPYTDTLIINNDGTPYKFFIFRIGYNDLSFLTEVDGILGTGLNFISDADVTTIESFRNYISTRMIISSNTYFNRINDYSEFSYIENLSMRKLIKRVFPSNSWHTRGNLLDISEDNADTWMMDSIKKILSADIKLDLDSIVEISIGSFSSIFESIRQWGFNVLKDISNFEKISSMTFKEISDKLMELKDGIKVRISAFSDIPSIIILDLIDYYFDYLLDPEQTEFTIDFLEKPNFEKNMRILLFVDILFRNITTFKKDFLAEAMEYKYTKFLVQYAKENYVAPVVEVAPEDPVAEITNGGSTTVVYSSGGGGSGTNLMLSNIVETVK